MSVSKRKARAMHTACAIFLIAGWIGLAAVAWNAIDSWAAAALVAASCVCSGVRSFIYALNNAHRYA